MQLQALFTTFLLAATASTAAVSSSKSSGDLLARLPSSASLQARDCNCGAKFACTDGVTACCSSTGGYGMCNTDEGLCACGSSCNPLQCKWDEI